MTRRRLSVLTPAVVTAFLATAVPPRAVYVVHHHDGDEHAHVHPFGAEPDDDHHHHPLPKPGDADLEVPEVFPAEHSHWQQPYQWAAAIAPIPLVPFAHVIPAPSAAPKAAPALAPATSVARGPPLTV